MKNVSPEFAEILGLLCAEGSHIISYVSYWGKDKGKPRYHINKKSERIEFYNSFLRGYFDGDGTVSNSARMFSCNKNGLNQVSLLLSNLNIQHTFQGPVLKEKRKPNYVVYIKAQSKERFLKNIEPISKRPVAYAGVGI